MTTPASTPSTTAQSAKSSRASTPATTPAPTPATTPRANQYDLTGRVVVITGGAGGLGRGVTAAFLKSGAGIVVADRAEARASVDATRGQLGQDADRLDFAAMDAGDEASVAAMVASVVARHGRLDVLANLVGGYSAGQPISELDLAVWTRMQDLNLRTAFLAAKHAAAQMIERGWGRILNISARAAYSGRKRAAAYAVAKAGIITLTETLSEELRDHRITANCVLPSIIDTPANRADIPDADFTRWPKPEDIARVLVFLASDDAWLISGAAIPVYGLA
jgi:NAD(P)-dependent dehydrogenase (short-subunit alcohol dehydrogenase family)